MPAEDYDPRGLALPLVDDESPVRVSSPVWNRRSSSFRRYDSPFPSHTPSFREQLYKNASKLHRRAMRTYSQMSTVQRILLIVGGLISTVLGILFLVYNERIFHAIAPFAKKWRDMTAGWLILWALIFIVSFPPLIGYSSLLTMAGFVYGFPHGSVALFFTQHSIS